MRFQHRLEYMVVCGVRTGCKVTPRSVLLRFADLLGTVWFRLDSRRRARTIDHITQAMGTEKSQQEIESIARNSFRYLARAIFDALELDRWTQEKIAKLTQIHGWEHIQKAYDSGRGVLLFSGHNGCWELVPHLQCQKGLPIDIVVRPLNNPLLDTLLNRLRQSCGNKTIMKRNAVRNILRSLHKGQGVAIVIDQNLRAPERIFVDFFGRPAATTPTLALMAQRTGAAIIPVFCLPNEDGTYEIRYLPEVQNGTTGDRKKDAHAITQACTHIIEETVREHPASWLWMHRRWRTQPKPGEHPLSPETSSQDVAVSG